MTATKSKYNIGDIVEYNWHGHSKDNIYLIVGMKRDLYGVPLYKCLSLLSGKEITYQFTTDARILA